MAIDPICKMEVDEANPAGGKTDYRDQTYYFCAPGCLRAFEGDPERYLGAEGGDTGAMMDASKPPRRSFFAKLFGRGT